MKFNYKKTQMMIISRKKITLKMELNNKEIQNTQLYTYLGDEFNSRNTYDDIIITRKKKAQQTIRDIISMVKQTSSKQKKRK